MSKLYEISKKRCVNCRHARMASFISEDDKMVCGLSKQKFYRNTEHYNSKVWIIEMDLRTLNVCSYWEELTDKVRIKSRLLGERIPPVDPRRGDKYQDIKPEYGYLDATGDIEPRTEEEVDAQMWTDKNTHTVQNV